MPHARLAFSGDLSGSSISQAWCGTPDYTKTVTPVYTSFTPQTIENFATAIAHHGHRVVSLAAKLGL